MEEEEKREEAGGEREEETTRRKEANQEEKMNEKKKKRERKKKGYLGQFSKIRVESIKSKIEICFTKNTNSINFLCKLAKLKLIENNISNIKTQSLRIYMP